MVSIIIPVYNRVDFIGETLDSIISQTYCEWECIVVDDGSNDYINELMEFYCDLDQRITFCKRPDVFPKGANSCRNYGFSLSKGDFINWFDSDDIMLPAFLYEKVNLFSRENEMVICKGYYTNEFLKVQAETLVELNQDLFKSFVLWKTHLLTPSILFRKSFLKGIRKFNPTIQKGQEAEFFSRILFNLPDKAFKITKNPLFYYRLHKGSSTIRNKEYIINYKKSESILGVENLKRCVELKDYELINYLYRKLIFLYFSALVHNDRRNSWFILNNLIRYIYKVDKFLSLLLSQLIIFPGISGKRSHRIERKLRLYIINDLKSYS